MFAVRIAGIKTRFWRVLSESFSGVSSKLGLTYAAIGVGFKGMINSGLSSL